MTVTRMDRARPGVHGWSRSRSTSSSVLTPTFESRAGRRRKVPVSALEPPLRSRAKATAQSS
nr:hypothetical protein JVH1_2829 [Rhodococcus sp. JVH1]